MTRTDVEKARTNLMHAVNRSMDGDWEATNQAILKAHGYLYRADEKDLADRVMVARGVGATSASARTELREVMQLVDARDETEQTMTQTESGSAFKSMGVGQ